MSAWGVGSFENDDALDWIAILEECDDLSVIEDSLRSVIDAEDYIELPESAGAVAAAEVIASVIGKAIDGLPPEIETWITNVNPKVTVKLKQLATRAIKRVKRKSEMQELWQESDHSLQWEAAMLDLESRLK